MTTRRYPPPPHVGAHDPAECDMCWQDLTAHLCLPPLPRRLPWRTRALSWWAGVGQPAARRWMRRFLFLFDVLMLQLGPAALMAVLLVGLAQDQPAPAAGTCTQVGTTWSCTR